jgi:cytochrome c oxidase cbb3-type subunit 2
VGQRAAVSVLAATVSVGIVLPSTAAQPLAVDLAAGRSAYQQHCARCHGDTGKGDGRDAKRHHPRPRDFTVGVYKFRSTATGTSPTDDDLFQTLTRGLPGSGMPDWRHLDESVRWQLVYYLKTLSPSFEETPPEPITTGNDPGRKRADMAKGKQVYEKLGCAACHGPHGRANGMSAATLTDNWDAALRPADLTYGWSYRGGSQPDAILTRMLAGIDGTPMPSYAEAVTTDEAWQLAYYVRSLQQPPRWGAVARAMRKEGRLPDSPDDPAWKSAQQTDIRLRSAVNAAGEIAASATVAAVSLRALVNDEAMSLRLSWHDPSEDRNEPFDALVLALRPEGVIGDALTLQTWPRSGSPALDLCAWTANHPQSRESVSVGYEPALTGTAPTVALAGQAVYQDGVWSLVLTRPLARKELPDGARLEPGHLSPVALAVWDGGNPGSRAISAWFDLSLGPPAEARDDGTKKGVSAYLVWLVAAVVAAIGAGLAIRKR